MLSCYTNSRLKTKKKTMLVNFESKTLFVNPKSLDDLKNSIWVMTGLIPAEQQLWFGNSRSMLNDQSLAPILDRGAPETIVGCKYSEPSDERLRIVVKALTGKIIQITASPSLSVVLLKRRIEYLESIPVTEQQLLLGPNTMYDSQTLDELGLSPNLAIIELGLVIHMRGGNHVLLPSEAVGTSKKSGKCAFANCSDKAVKIIGHCRHCSAMYCSKHRLPESHSCSGLHQIKKRLHQKAMDELLRNKCIASKIA